MSTGAVIGRLAEDGEVVGREVHYDGHPDTLGVALQTGYAELGYERLVSLLLDEHPAGWSAIVPDGDWSAPPAFSRFVRGGPQQCYCHGDRHEPARIVSDSQRRPATYAAFVYGLTPDGIVVRRRGGSQNGREVVVEWSDEATMRSLSKLLGFVD